MTELSRKQKLTLCLSCLLYGLSLWSWPLFDPDLGWQLLGGKHILTYGDVPRADFINTFNDSWHDYHWLAQVLFYKIYASFGYSGLQMLQGLIGLTLGGCLFFIVNKYTRKETLIACMLSFLLCFYMIVEVNSLRPQVLALILLALAYGRLISAPKPYDGILVLFFSILCVNMHVSWVFFPLLWLLLRCFTARTRKLSAYIFFLLIAASGFISPYGLLSKEAYPFLNYALIWDYLRMPALLKNYIFEMKSSLQAQGLLPYIFILTLLLIARYSKSEEIRKKPFLFILFLVGTFLAFRSTKFLALFALFSLPLLYQSLRHVTENYEKQIRKHASALTALFFLNALFIAGWSYPRTALEEHKDFYHLLPIKACRALASLPVDTPANMNHIRVLTHFNHGAWCRWILHEEAPHRDFRITTDGRTQWVPPEHYKLSFDLFSVKGKWANTLKQWNPDVAVVWKSASLAQFMARSYPSWKLIYEDDDFAIFMQPRAEHKILVG